MKPANSEVPSTMKAAVYRGESRVAVEEVATPEISAGEILIRVEACGVCHTDLKKVEYNLLPPPRIYGHETAGVVAKVGRGVDQYQPGDRVIVFHHIPCRECFYCNRGLYAQCPVYKKVGVTAGFEPAGGGFSQYVRVMDWIVRDGVERIPDGVSFERASFVEPLNTCLKAVHTSGAARGDSALVIGQGPIGLLFTMLLSDRGVRVLATDTIVSRLTLSRECGAEASFDPRAVDVAAELKARTDGRGADLVFVATAAKGLVEQAVAVSRPGSKICLFAQTSDKERIELSGASVCVGERTLFGSYSASVDLQKESAKLVFGDRLPIGRLISHRMALDEIGEAFHLATHPTGGLAESDCGMQQMMRAAVLRGKEQVAIEQVPIPELLPGDLLVRVRAALTCGTDVKVFRRGYHAKMIVPPALFGHEVAGDVVAGGQVGKRVVAANSAPCGLCRYCLKNKPNLCDDLLFNNGAYAEYIRIPARLAEKNTHEIPDGVDYRDAALTEPLACALKGLDDTGVAPGDTVSVIGLGPIGMMFIILAKLRGAHVIAVGRREEQIENARRLGADEGVTGEPVSGVMALTGGQGSDVVIEAVGKPETWDASVRMLRRGGTVNFFGGPPSGTTVALDTNLLHYSELTCKASFHHTPGHFRRAFEIICQGHVTARQFVNREAPLSDVPVILAELALQNGALKTAILP